MLAVQVKKLLWVNYSIETQCNGAANNYQKTKQKILKFYAEVREIQCPHQYEILLSVTDSKEGLLNTRKYSEENEKDGKKGGNHVIGRTI